MPKRLFIDYDKCIGCETCEMICKFTHGQPRIHMTRSREGIMMPLYCQHCDNPMCMNVCPHDAIHKDEEGAVLHDPTPCRACESKECLVACPFGAIFCTGEENTVIKCDMCASRRQRGQIPSCVEMCPCAAIVYVERDAVKQLQTPRAAAAFKRVMQHIKPKLDPLPGPASGTLSVQTDNPV